MENQIPVIDLFAGPGGLGEGFSSFSHKKEFPFRTVLSVEKDPFAVETLILRSFYRQFRYSGSAVCNEYYSYLRGEISKEELFEKYKDEAYAACTEAVKMELGKDNEKIHSHIKTKLKGAKEWVLIGGPPCQAFSLAGRSRMAKEWKSNPASKDEDERHFLYKEYLKIIAKFKPTVFVMENVKGILSATFSSANLFEKIQEDLRNPESANIKRPKTSRQNEYNLYSFTKETKIQKSFLEGNEISPKDFIINSEDFGIPQKRHRVFILGVRANLEIELEPLKKNPKQRTLREAISALPKLRSKVSKKTDSADEWKRSVQGIKNKRLGKSSENAILSDFIKKRLEKLAHNQSTGKPFIKVDNKNKKSFDDRWFYDRKLGGYSNHETRGHIEEDLQRYFFAACFAETNNRSPKLADFPKSLLPNHRNAGSQAFSDRFRIQLFDKPATTITSHISKDGHYYIHPDPLQCRSLTVREAARIQTFPDNYFFEGPRTSQYTQVGNAVPPLLARELAEKVHGILSKAGCC